MSDNVNPIDTLFKEGLQHAKIKPPVDAFATITSQVSSSAVGSSVVAGFKVGVMKVALFTVATAGILGTWLYLSEGQQTDVKEKKAVSRNEIRRSQEETLASDLTGRSTVPAGQFQTGKSSQEKGTRSAISKAKSEKNVTNQGLADLKISPKEPDTKMPTPSLFDRNAARNDIQEESRKRDDAKATAAHSVRNPLLARTIECKKRELEFSFLEGISGLEEWAFTFNGEWAQYHWGHKSKTWGSKSTKEVQWKGTVYVKKSQEMTMWVRANYQDGCKDTFYFSRWVQPKENKEEEVFPTVFTPNEDGYNDSFFVKIPEPKQFEMFVIDDRGTVVFQTKNFQDKWDGKYQGFACISGYYTVMIKRMYDEDDREEVKSYRFQLKRN